MLSLLFCNQDEHVDASQILEKEYGYPKAYFEPEVFMKSWAHEIVVEAEEKGLKKGLRRGRKEGHEKGRKEGRIEGASKIGNLWVIPVDTPKPDDNRIKSGKYIKKKDW